MGILITVDEDIVNNVLKPMSLFLNEIKEGAIFTHIPLTARASDYKIEKKGDAVVHPTFKFASSTGGTYKFTAYDLRNFTCAGQSFADYFIPRPGTKPNLQGTFTAGVSTPVLVNDEKVYPLFCYNGFTEFDNLRKEMDKGDYPTDEMYIALKASGVKDNAVNKFYRQIDIDKPIFYFDEGTK